MRNLLFLFLFYCFVEEEEDEGDENIDEDDNLSTPNTTLFIGNGGSSIVDSSTTTSGILRSKDLRTVVETKRRNFSRSRSSSDSEENAGSFDMTRSSNRKQQTRSPTRLGSFQDSTELISGTMKNSIQFFPLFSLFF